MKSAFVAMVCAILLLAGQANAVRFYDSGAPEVPIWRYLAGGEGLAQRFTVSGVFELDSASFGAVSEDGHVLGTFALYTGIGAPTDMIGSWGARIDKESPQDMIRWTNTSVHDRIVLTPDRTYWAALMAPSESRVKVAMYSTSGDAGLAWYVPDAWDSIQVTSYGPATLRLWGNELRVEESVPEPASFAILTGGMAVLGVVRTAARRRRRAKQ